MFKKSRRKIVAAIMSVLTLLWIGTLGVIYISSYFEVSSTNLEMLEEHAALYVLDKPIGDFNPSRPSQNRGPHVDTNQFKLSTFYSVAISYDGELLEVNNAEKDVFTDEELEAAAREVLNKDSFNGTTNDLIYYKVDNPSV